MENEWVAGVILTGLLLFCIVITIMVRRAMRKLEESEQKKQLLKNGIEFIKQRWTGKQS